MAYGKSAWGIAAYGDAPLPPGVFRFSSAVAMDTHRIRVTLTRAAKAVSSYGAGDALNPATWTVTRLDTLAVLTTLTVTKISSTVYDLIMLEALGAYSVSHKVSSDTLLAEDGTIIGVPNFAIFQGMTTSVVLGEVERAQSVGVDLRNLPAPSAVTIAGTLVMTDGGDYAVEGGAPLLKKLVLRRLFTDQGGFFHLPSYGLGLREKRKVGISFLPQLKREIEAQIKREPEVEDASASLSLSSNVLTVRIRAKMRAASTPVEVTAAVPL